MRPAATLLILALSLGGCGSEPNDTDQQEILDARADNANGPNGLEGFNEDNSGFVVRQRLDIAGSPGHVATMTEQPFSHRSKRWHVFPFTTYGESNLTVDIGVRDTKMADRTAVWVFGPRREDGSWGEARYAYSSQGAATVELDVPGYGQYVAVVGPPEEGFFLPRYPGHQAHFQFQDADGNDVEEDVSLRMEGNDVYLELANGERLKVHEPVTGYLRSSDVPTEAFNNIWADDGTGNLKLFHANDWARSVWMIREDGGEDDLILGLINEPQEGEVELIDGPSSTDTLIVSTLGAHGQAAEEPLIYNLVPAAHENQEIIVRREEECDQNEMSCNVPLYLHDDGTTPVPEELIHAYRSTFIDFGESSTYDITVSCTGTCEPRTGPTKHPVYFAHGFNSAASTWDDLFAAMTDHDPAWNGWLWSKDVPGFEPVPNRTEVLRRNLLEYVDRLQTSGVAPAAGEDYIRLNIVAHSMGGLDSRYLIGTEKYNNDECHILEECLAEDGTAEPCCPTDGQGYPIQWRERIASVTTLSTPHCGSSFATWSLEMMERRTIGGLFQRLSAKIFGVDPNTQGELLNETLYALSQRFCDDVMASDYPPPIAERDYSWDCATGEESCHVPQDAHLPVFEDGRYLLPSPTADPTIFSWAGRACVTGSCGDTIAPSLLASFRIVLGREGDNDGVVSTSSAEFGLFMGIRPTDHFHWSRFTYSTSASLVGRLFGVKREPPDRFYRHWFDKLRQAGY